MSCSLAEREGGERDVTYRASDDHRDGVTYQ